MITTRRGLQCASRQLLGRNHIRIARNGTRRPSIIECCRRGLKASSEAEASSPSAFATVSTPPSPVTVEPPTLQQLRIVAMRSAIPMIGFGFMDNIVMIQAGEAIDMSLGVTFGLSTLTAAGFGQCVSDVAGFTCGGIVDAAVSKMNLPHHNLSPAQLDLQVTRTCHTFGGCVGVVAGCLLGMTSLLFMDTDRADRAKKAKELTSIFESILEEGHLIINAERASLWLLDEDSSSQQKFIWSRVASGVDGVIKAPLDGSIVGECIRTGRIINIEDAYQDDRFDPENDRFLGFRTKSLLAVPVMNEKGKVIGAVQMMNKKDEANQGNFTSFGEGDIRCVKMLCSHVACFMRVVNAG